MIKNFKDEILKFVDGKEKFSDITVFSKKFANKNELDAKTVENQLSKMISRGEILIYKGSLLSSSALNLKKGIITGRGYSGFLFINPENKTEKVEVETKNCMGAISGDCVLYKIKKDGKAEVVSILKRKTDEKTENRCYTGIVRYELPNFFVETSATSRRIILPKGLEDGINLNDKVRVEVVFQPADSKSDLIGEIKEVYGQTPERETMIKMILDEFGIAEEFSPKTLTEAKNLPQEIEIVDIKSRLDLRKELIFTIDGADTRDIDDAISIKKHADGTFTLGVHIADVSHYVKAGSSTDSDAMHRATSVYFPNKVIPMLPKELSNGICSLNPDVDRLALSVFMDFDEIGDITDYKIVESVIRSHKKFTYDEILKIIQNDEEIRKNNAEYIESIENMSRLSNILTKNADLRGYLNLEIPESKFEFDSEGNVKDVLIRTQNESHRLIENFMIATNITVANHMSKNFLPCPYRVHEEPAYENVKKLLAFMEVMGVNKIVQPKRADAKFYQTLLNVFKEKENRYVFNMVILKSLQRAKYFYKNLGHFGLALQSYCHFTSPIRRYSDLALHRILKYSLNNKLTDAKAFEFENFALDVCDNSSFRERQAEHAENKNDDRLKAEWAGYHIGEEFDAIISGMGEFGVFAELPNSVEGLVRTEDLLAKDLKYIKLKEQLANSKKVYKLGDKIRVLINTASEETGKISLIEINKSTKKK